MNKREMCALAMVTAPNLKTARKLAKSALTAKLVACANLVSKIESHYWWNGAIEHGPEVLVLLKTRRSKLSALEKLIIEEHPYDTPEFVIIPITRGNKRYLDWISRSVQ